jgi:hypothetical protein
LLYYVPDVPSLFYTLDDLRKAVLIVYDCLTEQTHVFVYR